MIRRVLFLCAALVACTPAGEPPDLPAPPAEAPPAAGAAADIPARPGDVDVKTPVAGARVTSPLTVEGAAINTFFFEGVFPVELHVDGAVIAEARGNSSRPPTGPNRDRSTSRRR